MKDGPLIANVAALIGDPARANILTALMDGRALTASELDRFEAVVMDPPRIGAARQSAELARSGVPVVAAVSCNPSSFARDAALLVEGGYRLESIVPVDQFLWSAHVELVAAFRRR